MELTLENYEEFFDKKLSDLFTGWSSTHEILEDIKLLNSLQRQATIAEVMRNAEVLFQLGEEIIEEARPLYDYGDDGDETPNEMYTIVDYQINLRKMRAKYSPSEDTDKGDI